MKCSRCQGLMVRDHLLDIKETMGSMWVQSWRCVACGNIIDPLIEKHRMERAALVPQLVPVVVNEYEDDELTPPLAA